MYLVLVVLLAGGKTPLLYKTLEWCNDCIPRLLFRLSPRRKIQKSLMYGMGCVDWEQYKYQVLVPGTKYTYTTKLCLIAREAGSKRNRSTRVREYTSTKKEIPHLCGQNASSFRNCSSTLASSGPGIVQVQYWSRRAGDDETTHKKTWIIDEAAGR